MSGANNVDAMLKLIAKRSALDEILREEGASVWSDQKGVVAVKGSALLPVGSRR